MKLAVRFLLLLFLVVLACSKNLVRGEEEETEAEVISEVLQEVEAEPEEEGGEPQREEPREVIEEPREVLREAESEETFAATTAEPNAGESESETSTTTTTASIASADDSPITESEGEKPQVEEPREVLREVESEETFAATTAEPHADESKSESESSTTTTTATTTASADDSQNTSTSSSNTSPNSNESTSSSTSRQQAREKEPEFDPTNMDWGSYYDPQNVFCGKYDCYKILGFDYESFGRVHPDTRTITKRYRSLSRHWHPDKNKHPTAKSRFVQIARAYEVLTNHLLRKEYDDMRYDQELYYQKYGTSVLWSYAPKSDVTIVMLIILVIGNVFSWFSQKHRWRLVADRLIKAAVEDWTPSQGGTPESKHLREEALAILAEREAAATAQVNGSTGSNDGATGKKSKGSKKVSGKEKKKQEQEAILPIIRDMVYQMDDFGCGFHKPTWRDLLIVTLARLPILIGKETIWFSKYYIRRLKKLPLTDEEILVLTQRAVGPIAWEAASEKERKDWLKRELWKVTNLAEWSEEQELNKLSASDRKYYLQMKKKGMLIDKED